MTKQITLAAGAVFGRLTVIGNCMLGRYSAAICKCECGNTKTVRRWSLTSAKKPTLSCGCLALEAARIALKCDRGSSFESPEAYEKHRKAWCKEYAKKYDARPEQRIKRNQQKKEWLAAMTDEDRRRQRDLVRSSRSKPEQKSKITEAQKAYRTKPENAERIKQRLKLYKGKQRDELSDSYVACCFLQDSNLKPKDLPKEVIETVRQSMLLKRSIKESMNEKRN